MLRGLFSLEAWKVSYDDRAAIYFQKPFGLESAEISGDEFPHSTQFRRQVLVGRCQFQADSLFCSGSASLG